MNNNEHYKQLVLTRLSQCKNLRHLKQVQTQVVVLGHSQTQFYACKLLRFAATAANSLSYARLIFSSLRSPNVFLFAAVITAHADRRLHRDAVELYRLMLRLGISKPNHFVYPQVLRSAAEALSPRARGSVHAQIVKAGFDRDPVVMTGLLCLYAKFRSDVEFARKVFDEIPEAERNVVAWTSVITGHIRAGDVERALTLFDAMPGRDIAAWNAAIAGSAQTGLFERAVSLFARLINEGGSVKPNSVTVASVLPACGTAGSLRLAQLVHGHACRNGLIDPFVSNSLIDVYGKCGLTKYGRRVFDNAVGKCSTSWNSMINCYGLNGMGENAIKIFDAMIKVTRPDDITFVGLLNACAHGGLVNRGLAYFDLMIREYGIEPKIEHFGCLIDLLARAGRFDEALEVVREMNFEPDAAVWGSLLNGCMIHRRPDLAEFVIRKITEIDPSNVGYFSVLANTYKEIGCEVLQELGSNGTIEVEAEE